MDVSIAVSLIRGQMGTVVERAVNAAVETVLAEMLRVVGVKFEELKAEVVLMKRDMVALQREKALKEKENDNIRAKLRYTELKLKYYRQGVEEELQQRAAASTLVRVHPPSFPRTQKDRVSPTSPSPHLTRGSQVPECTSSQSSSRRAIRVSCPADTAGSEPSGLLLPVSLAVTTPAETLDSGADQDAAQSQEQVDECEWTIALQPHAEGVDAAVAPPPPPLHALTLDVGRQSAADSSTLPSSAPQVKQEEEVICIKEEPEEEQEVMAALLLDCKVQQAPPSESEGQRSVLECSRLPAGQMNHGAVGPCSYPPQLAASLPPSIPPRQAVRPWTKDLSLYEEYKLRRNELRRRNLSRRRELEKTLPQPLLADLVRERREKTRLRVARWRAKRKLQAFLSQTQAHGGAAGLPQTSFPVSSQQQQLRAAASSAGSQQRQSAAAAPPSSRFLSSSIAAILPLMPSSSSSYHPQVSLSQQSISLTDTDELQ